MTKAELEKRIANLEALVATLQAHQCPQVPQFTWQAEPWCTCGTTAACQKHQMPKTFIWSSFMPTQGAADHGWQNYYVTCGQPFAQIRNYQPAGAAAGCAPTVILNS